MEEQHKDANFKRLEDVESEWNWILILSLTLNQANFCKLSIFDVTHTYSLNLKKQRLKWFVYCNVHFWISNKNNTLDGCLWLSQNISCFNLTFVIILLAFFACQKNWYKLLIELQNGRKVILYWNVWKFSAFLFTNFFLIPWIWSNLDSDY